MDLSNKPASNTNMLTNKSIKESITLTITYLEVIQIVKRFLNKNAKTKSQALAECLIAQGSIKKPKQNKIQIPYLIVIEFIWLGKQRVSINQRGWRYSSKVDIQALIQRSYNRN